MNFRFGSISSTFPCESEGHLPTDPFTFSTLLYHHGPSMSNNLKIYSVYGIFGEERRGGWGSLVSVDRRDPDFFVSPDPRGGVERSQNMLSREWSSLVWDAASEWLGQAPSYHHPKVEIPRSRSQNHSGLFISTLSQKDQTSYWWDLHQVFLEAILISYREIYIFADVVVHRST